MQFNVINVSHLQFSHFDAESLFHYNNYLFQETQNESHHIFWVIMLEKETRRDYRLHTY